MWTIEESEAVSITGRRASWSKLLRPDQKPRSLSKSTSTWDRKKFDSWNIRHTLWLGRHKKYRKWLRKTIDFFQQTMVNE